MLGRPSLAEDGRGHRGRGGGAGHRLARRPVPPAAAARQRPRRPRHGPGPGLLPGRTSLDDGRGLVPRPLGRRARAPRAATPPRRSLAAGRATARSGRSCCSAATRSRDFPDRALADRALRERRRRDRGGRPPWPRARPRRRGAAGRGGPRAARHHHQHRGPGHPARPEAGPARPGLARLDDRRRRSPTSSASTSPSARRRTSPRRSSGSPRPTAASRPGSSTRRRATTGSWCPLGAAHVPAGRRRSTPWPSPGVESVERQGAPPRVGLTEPVSRELLAALAPGRGRGRRRRCVRRPGRATAVARPAARPLLAAAGLDPAPLRPRRRGGRRRPSLAAARAAPATRRPTPPSWPASGVEPGDRVRVRSPAGQVVAGRRGRRRACPRGVLASTSTSPRPTGVVERGGRA